MIESFKEYTTNLANSFKIYINSKTIKVLPPTIGNRFLVFYLEMYFGIGMNQSTKTLNITHLNEAIVKPDQPDPFEKKVMMLIVNKSEIAIKLYKQINNLIRDNVYIRDKIREIDGDIKPEEWNVYSIIQIMRFVLYTDNKLSSSDKKWYKEHFKRLLEAKYNGEKALS